MLKNTSFLKKFIPLILVVIFTFSLTCCNKPAEEEVTAQIAVEESLNLCLKEEYATASFNPYLLINGERAEGEFSYESADSSIATVTDQGVINALTEGVANISISTTYEGQTLTATSSVKVYATVEESQVNSFNKQSLNLFGRVVVSGGRVKKLKVDHAASGFEVSFFGTQLTVTASATEIIYCRYFVDGESEGTFKKVWNASTEYQVAKDLKEGYHTVRFLKCSELTDGLLTIENISTDGVFVTPEKRNLKIEFIGDSITAGYGSLGKNPDARSVKNSDGTKALAYLTAQKLNADYSIIALAGIAINVHMWRTDITMNELYKQLTLNDTSAYDFESWQPDVVVCLMGENSYGYCVNKDPSYFSRYPNDYLQFLQYIKSVRPNAKIVCVYGMMNYDVNIHNAITKSAATLGQGATCLLMKGNFDGAGAHPNEKAQKEYASIIAEHIRSIT